MQVFDFATASDIHILFFFMECGLIISVSRAKTYDRGMDFS